MNKRYQVFISSTFADLKDERREVIQAVMQMDCIPAGMELFPASDDEQWKFIQRVIDDSDYYILIIGNRYGSVTPEGVSYTEMEFDYALEIGLKVLAFVHEEPDELPVTKSDIDPAARRRLAAFRDRVKTDRLVKMWRKPSDLPGLVALSLTKTMTTYPAVGWVRTPKASNEDLLEELNTLRKQLEQRDVELYELRKAVRPPKTPKKLAGLDDQVTVAGTYANRGTRYPWELNTTWLTLFGLIAPDLLSHPSDDIVRKHLAAHAFALTRKLGVLPELGSSIFQTIKVQFSALGLVTVDYTRNTAGGMGLFWSLTTDGENLMYETRAIGAK